MYFTESEFEPAYSGRLPFRSETLDDTMEIYSRSWFKPRQFPVRFHFLFLGKSVIKILLLLSIISALRILVNNILVFRETRATALVFR